MNIRTASKEFYFVKVVLVIVALFMIYILSSGPVNRMAPPRVAGIIYAPLIWMVGSSSLWQPWLEFWGIETARSACIKNLRQIDSAAQQWNLSNTSSTNSVIAGTNSTSQNP